jgi:hypothetical protein
MINYMVFFIIVGFGWYWWHSVSAYEVAYQQAKARCKQLELQFLDDTLDLEKLRLCRHSKGYMQFCRLYQFEFSSDGNSRYIGYVQLSGLQFEKIEMEAYRIEDESG